ncbi:MAG TPA: adenylate kinase [Dehalococcoidia bacterium]|nr:adenylate kinase [Dehalococcoidia bacterium]MDP6273575.1 adenylate kinase [Dehalococcoidia bacterium]MDP7159940.1 adenylate kinase [Dehalococcoidia bacterium]MDP7212444.1 adenylate kinase [Dehalococcoidia bacterium]MDP7513761.1 adenylate kinase [Dehalococcoidia bacterium]
MLIVFLGAPGAGKGTQAKALAGEKTLTHLATGDLLRVEVAAGSELGLAARAFMDRGDLVPDDVMIGMIQRRLESPGSDGIVLDGFPRTVAQARALDEALAADGTSVDRSIYFEVSEKELVRRLAGRATCSDCQRAYHDTFNPPKNSEACDDCGTELIRREDDKPEAVLNRLKVYETQTTPVLDHYRTMGKLVTVDGEQSIDAVQKDLAGAVG